MPSHAHDADSRINLEDLVVECRPWRDEPRTVAAAAAAVLAAAICAAIVSQKWSVTLAAIALPAAAAWRLWIHTRYRFTPIGIEQRTLGLERMVPWTAFGRFELRQRGILLLPHAEKSAIGAFRGLYVAWGNHRGDVLNQVEHHLVRS